MCIISGAVALATSLGTALGATAGAAGVGAGLAAPALAVGASGASLLGLGTAGAATAGIGLGTGLAVTGGLLGAAAGITSGILGYSQAQYAAEAQEAQYEAAVEAASRERDAEIAQARYQLRQRQEDVRLQQFESQQRALEERARVGAAMSGLGIAGPSYERVFQAQALRSGIREEAIKETEERARSTFSLQTMEIQSRLENIKATTPRGVSPSGLATALDIGGGALGGAISGFGLGAKTSSLIPTLKLG